MTRDDVARTSLPIPDREHSGAVTYDAKDPATSFAPIQPLRPPAGAPNVLVVMLDDAGFGSSSAFGGPCETPTFERLAGQGLRFNRFHTTALCAPTRQALLTGRNHHSVGMGVITELATAAPGYNSIRPNTCAPLAQTLLLNGYSTSQFGKCHEVPVWHLVALAELRRRVAVQQQRLRQQRAGIGANRVVAGCRGGELGDNPHSHRVVVAAGQQGSPRRRAQRRRVEAVVLQAVAGQPLS